MTIREVWKDVVVDKEEKNKYKGLYMISNLGRIKRLYKSGKELILTPQDNRDGYLKVRLSTNNKGKNYKIHRLVALAFIENPENKQYIDHIDTNRHNNCVDNLRWCTNIENMNNEITKNKISESCSKKVYQYTKELQLVRIWKSVKECFENGYYNVSKCCSGERKTCNGYIWKHELI